jgi:RNA polymerase sigma-70 factor (ECF subfamily)
LGAVERSDEELMVRFQAGDADSFAILAGRYAGPLYGLASRCLGRPEDAEEVRQEALMKAYSQAARFRPDGRFRSWIYRIALNLCHDRNRRRRRLQWVALGEADAPPPERAVDGPHGELQRREAQEVVRQALQELSEEQRVVVVLKEYEDLKFREIAEVLGCPESTVKSRLYRALTALRDRLVRPPAADTGRTFRTEARPGAGTRGIP